MQFDRGNGPQYRGGHQYTAWNRGYTVLSIFDITKILTEKTFPLLLYLQTTQAIRMTTAQVRTRPTTAMETPMAMELTPPVGGVAKWDGEYTKNMFIVCRNN